MLVLLLGCFAFGGAEAAGDGAPHKEGEAAWEEATGAIVATTLVGGLDVVAEVGGLGGQGY